jgi:hypothetical protein
VVGVNIYIYSKFHYMKAKGLIGLAMAGMLAVAGAASAQSEQVRPVSGYSSIGNAGSFAVHIKINGTESLKIDGADEETLAKIETNVTGGNLEIRWKRGSEPHHYSGRIDIYVTAKSLSAITCAGSGSTDVDGALKGGNVDVTLSGSGSISTAIDAGKLGITISGSGAVKLKGKAGTTDITISGSGKLSADGLATDVAEVEISGSGDTYITVNKTISANIVGSGSVHYSGAGTVGSVKTVGSGRVSRAR